jgi:hypothetical protein
MATELDSLVCLLEDWAAWQSTWIPKNGYKSRSAGFAAIGLQSFEDMCERSDSITMKTLDASISSLEPPQTAAINRRYGVCRVFMFPRNNYEATLIEAHARLVVICKRKGVVL